MALSVTVSWGALPNPFSWNDLVAFVQSVTVGISGSVGSADIADGAITADHVRPDAYSYAAGALSAGVYSVTLDPALTAYASGVWLLFEADTANSGAVDLDVNGLGTKSLLKFGGAEFEAGEIAAGHIVLAVYDGTQFRALSVNALPELWRAGTAAGTGDALEATLTPSTLTLANLSGRLILLESSAVNTGAATLEVNELAAKPIRTLNNAALVAGDIAGADQVMLLTYDATLDVFILLSNVAGRDSAIVASARNLILQNNAASAATSVDVDADELILKSSTQSMVASSVNVTAAITASGANGLDTGSEASGTWYYVWVIFDPATGTTAGLLSTSATAPTLPAGYTFKALVGAIYNDAGSDFDTVYQRDRTAWINETNVLTSGDPGAADTYESLAFATVVPPMARSVRGTAGADSNARACITLAGDGNGLGAQSVVVPPAASAANSFWAGGAFHVPLKTAQTIYWKAQNDAANYRINISGWEI